MKTTDDKTSSTSGAGDDGASDDTSIGQMHSIEHLQQQIADLQEQLHKFRDMAARSQAELQNAKDRIQKEAQDMRTFATESVIMRILPTLDNFQRAFQHMPDLKKHEDSSKDLVDWVMGVNAIEQELMRHMKDLGLKRMESQGQAVDPARHEVLMATPGKEGTVVEVLEEGYELHGKVLRPAKVKAGDGASS